MNTYQQNPNNLFFFFVEIYLLVVQEMEKMLWVKNFTCDL